MPAPVGRGAGNHMADGSDGTAGARTTDGSVGAALLSVGGDCE